jgi:hypothetical protein
MPEWKLKSFTRSQSSFSASEIAADLAGARHVQPVAPGVGRQVDELLPLGHVLAHDGREAFEAQAKPGEVVTDRRHPLGVTVEVDYVDERSHRRASLRLRDIFQSDRLPLLLVRHLDLAVLSLLQG